MIKEKITLQYMNKEFFNKKWKFGDTQRIRNADKLTVLMFLISNEELGESSQTADTILQNFITLKKDLYSKNAINEVVEESPRKVDAKLVSDHLHKRDFSDELSRLSENNFTNNKVTDNYHTTNFLFIKYKDKSQGKSIDKYALNENGIQIAVEIMMELNAEVVIHSLAHELRKIILELH